MISHTGHDHPATAAGRAACRKAADARRTAALPAGHDWYRGWWEAMVETNALTGDRDAKMLLTQAEENADEDYAANTPLWYYITYLTWMRLTEENA